MSNKTTSVFNVLQKKGYQPQIKGKDIVFQVKGYSFIFQYYEGPLYVIMLPNIYELGDTTKGILDVLNRVNKESLVAKIVVHQNSVHVAAQAVYPDVKIFEVMLENMIEACINCAFNFHKYINKQSNNKVH